MESGVVAMKTVQEAMRSLDRETLAREYANIHPRTIHPFREDEDMDEVSCGEIKARTREGLNNLIDLVCELEPRAAEDGRRCIIFGYPCPKGSPSDLDVQQGLVYEDELLRQGETAPNYGYSLTDWAEVLGWLVADTDYTQKHLCEVMAQVLYEMTWWGFTPEAVAAEREETFAEEDEEEEPDEELSAFREQFTRELEECAAKEEARPLEEKLLQRQCEEAANAYGRYLRGRELAELAARLSENKKRDRAETEEEGCA